MKMQYDSLKESVNVSQYICYIIIRQFLSSIRASYLLKKGAFCVIKHRVLHDTLQRDNFAFRMFLDWSHTKKSLT